MFEIKVPHAPRFFFKFIWVIDIESSLPFFLVPECPAPGFERAPALLPAGLFVGGLSVEWFVGVLMEFFVGQRFWRDGGRPLAPSPRTQGVLRPLGPFRVGAAMGGRPESNSGVHGPEQIVVGI